MSTMKMPTMASVARERAKARHKLEEDGVYRAICSHYGVTGKPATPADVYENDVSKCRTRVEVNRAIQRLKKQGQISEVRPIGRHIVGWVPVG